MNVKLVKPTIELKEEYMDFYHEWKSSGEKFVPWVIGKDPTNFEQMVNDLHNSEKGIGLKEGWVPDSTYWSIDDSQRVIGVVNIRHQLTEHLMTAGGHIGYGIRPTERQKGYATKQLELSLVEAKELNINPVLVVCDAWNKGSEKTILNNGGVRDTDFIEEDGNVILRFWIYL